MAVLPKKGDTSYPKNFRAIMVGDFDGKISQLILNNRLQILYEQIAHYTRTVLDRDEEDQTLSLFCYKP